MYDKTKIILELALFLNYELLEARKINYRTFKKTEEYLLTLKNKNDQNKN